MSPTEIKLKELLDKERAKNAELELAMMKLSNTTNAKLQDATKKLAMASNLHETIEKAFKQNSIVQGINPAPLPAGLPAGAR